MEAPPRSKKSTSWVRRVIAWLVVGTFSLVVLLALAYGLRNEVIAPLALRWLERRVESETGLVLSIDEVGGDWIHELRVSGVTLHAREPGHEIEFVSLGELELAFDLRRLLAGDLAGLERVDVREAVARLDLAQPARPTTGPSTSTFTLPARLPSGALSGLDLAIKFPGGRRLAFSRAGVRIDAGANANRIALDVPSATVDMWPGAPALVERARGELEYDRGVLAVRQLELGGDLDLRATHSQLDLRRVARGGLGWSASLEGFGGALHARGELVRADLALEVDLRGIELASVARVFAPLARSWPTGSVDLVGDLVVVAGDLSATAQASARELCTFDREFDFVAADLSFVDRTLDVARLEIAQGPNALHGRALSIPFDRDDWIQQLRASRGRIELELTDVNALTRASTQRVPAHHIDIAGELGENGVELTSGEIVSEGGQLVVSRGRVEWGAVAANFIDTLSLDVDTSADFHDLAPLATVFGRQGWSGSMHGALRIAGTLAEPLGRLDMLGEDVVAEGLEVGDFHALARIDSERIHVESLAADGRYGHVELGGDLLLASREIEHARVTLASQRLDELLPSEFERGRFALEAELAGPLEAPFGTFALTASDLAPRCNPVVPELAALGRFDARALHFDELSLAVEQAHARLSGSVEYRARPVSIALATAVVERAGLELALTHGLEFRADPRALELRDVALAGSAGRIAASVAWREGRLDVQAVCDDLNPMPLVAPFAPEGFALRRAHGKFELGLTDERLDLAADFGLEGLRFAADAPLCALTCRGDYSAGRARIEALDLRSDDGGFAKFAGVLPIDVLADEPLVDGELSLSGTFELPTLAGVPWRRFSPLRSLDGALAGEVELAGAWRALRGSLSATGQGVRLVPADPKAPAVESMLAPANFELRATFGDALELEHLSFVAPGQVSFDAVGRAEIGGDLFALAADVVRTTPVELHVTLTADDLAFITGLAPRWLRRTGGALSGELELHGTLDDPEVVGALRLERGELRTQSALPTIDRLNGSLRFDGRRVTIEELRGEVGAGSLEASGSVALDSGEPELALKLRGRDILLVQRRELRARANADLEVTGLWSALHIAGRVDLTDGRFHERVEWIDKSGRPRSTVGSHEPWFTLAGTPFADATFAVAIGATQPFHIDVDVPGVAYARAALRPGLTLRGNGHSPALVGPIYFETGRVSLTGSTLEISVGSVTLDDLEPRSPQLDLVLETRLVGHDVTVQVDGRANDPRREAYSDPPLSEEAIYQLLLSGQLPSEGSLAESSLDTAQAVAVYLGQDILSRWFGDGEPGEESFLDRIEWTRGADVTKAGGSTFEARLRVAGPQRGPGKIVLLRGDRDLYDRINFGLRFLLRVE